MKSLKKTPRKPTIKVEQIKTKKKTHTHTHIKTHNNLIKQNVDFLLKKLVNLSKGLQRMKILKTKKNNH